MNDEDLKVDLKQLGFTNNYRHRTVSQLSTHTQPRLVKLDGVRYNHQCLARRMTIILMKTTLLLIKKINSYSLSVLYLVSSYVYFVGLQFD